MCACSAVNASSNRFQLPIIVAGLGASAPTAGWCSRRSRASAGGLPRRVTPAIGRRRGRRLIASFARTWLRRRGLRGLHVAKLAGIVLQVAPRSMRRTESSSTVRRSAPAADSSQQRWGFHVRSGPSARLGAALSCQGRTSRADPSLHLRRRQARRPKNRRRHIREADRLVAHTLNSPARPAPADTQRRVVKEHPVRAPSRSPRPRRGRRQSR